MQRQIPVNPVWPGQPTMGAGGYPQPQYAPPAAAGPTGYGGVPPQFQQAAAHRGGMPAYPPQQQMFAGQYAPAPQPMVRQQQQPAPPPPMGAPMHHHQLPPQATVPPPRMMPNANAPANRIDINALFGGGAAPAAVGLPKDVHVASSEELEYQLAGSRR